MPYNPCVSHEPVFSTCYEYFILIQVTADHIMADATNYSSLPVDLCECTI